jgi:NAD(P)-dependent dehydrogenase (short-subunit alcohol dehydrogenase family)
MREQGSGAIVNCSSLGGLIGGPRRGTYHAAKHGVLGSTKSAALEYATRGIRVDAVCPGMIQTPMSDQMIAEGQGEELNVMLKTYVPMGRLGRPEEIADAVLWLCSELCYRPVDLDRRWLRHALDRVTNHPRSRTKQHPIRGTLQESSEKEF